MKLQDMTIEMDWKLKSLNDSITKVTLLLKDKHHSLKQKMLVPFIKTEFVKQSLEIATKIRDGLVDHSKKFKVSSIEETTLELADCIYMPIECKMYDKANLMIKNTAFIMEVIRVNDLELIGDPYLEITNWNMDADSISYNFCFPIKNKENIPESDEIFFKKAETKKALKAVFNGNYRISDRAWFTLIEYADRHDISTEALPIEVFIDNPHNGGNELEWEAKVYMPLK